MAKKSDEGLIVLLALGGAAWYLSRVQQQPTLPSYQPPSALSPTIIPQPYVPIAEPTLPSPIVLPSSEPPLPAPPLLYDIPIQPKLPFTPLPEPTLPQTIALPAYEPTLQAPITYQPEPILPQEPLPPPPEEPVRVICTPPMGSSYDFYGSNNDLA